jgi:hypothetical protein
MEGRGRNGVVVTATRVWRYHKMTQQTLGELNPEYHHGRVITSAGYEACPQGVLDCKACPLDRDCNPRPEVKAKGRREKP